MFTKGLKWKLIEGDFDGLRSTLDNLMKDCASKSIGTVKRQAEMLTFKHEQAMWDKGFLGESNPTLLRDTVIFLLGIYAGLRAGDEHCNLRRDTTDLASQISFKRNDAGVRCAVYTEDCTTKTNDGGINSMRKDRKIVWIYPSSNKVRCPVRILDKYVSLLPQVKPNRKSNFYLRSLERFTPAQWYGEQVVGLNSIRKVIETLAENSGLEGFFTNHSLRRTGITRLFQAGVDRKLVKEFSGHSSDAVDAYQITSHDQRKAISAVISGDSKSETCPNVENLPCMHCDMKADQPMSVTISSKENSQESEVDKLGHMLKDLMNIHKDKKVKINLSIELE